MFKYFYYWRINEISKTLFSKKAYFFPVKNIQKYTKGVLPPGKGLVRVTNSPHPILNPFFVSANASFKGVNPQHCEND